MHAAACGCGDLVGHLTVLAGRYGAPPRPPAPGAPRPGAETPARPCRRPPPTLSRLTRDGLVGTVAMGPAAKVETAPPPTETTSQKI